MPRIQANIYNSRLPILLSRFTPVSGGSERDACGIRTYQKSLLRGSLCYQHRLLTLASWAAAVVAYVVRAAKLWTAVTVETRWHLEQVGEFASAP